MRYWAAPEQRGWETLSWRERTLQRVPCSPLEWDGSLCFGPPAALWNRERVITGEEGKAFSYFAKC